MVHVTGGTAPIEVLSDDPMYDRFLRTLGRYGRVITLDRPGIGASDGFDPDCSLLDQGVEAYLAVLDAVGVSSAWVVQKGGYLAARVAARHRMRIDGAVILSERSPAKFLEQAAQVEKILERGQLASGLLESSIPSRAGDPAFLEWHDRAGRLGATAEGARAYYAKALADIARGMVDEEPDVITEPIPAAIVHRRNAALTRLDDCKWWLDRLPGSEPIVIDGIDEMIEGLDAGTLADTMGTFITGERASSADERPLVAVMFSDLVDSTPQVAADGDVLWKSTLDRYEHQFAAVVDRHHGSVVKFTGDGGLATFPSGSRALSAAVDLRGGTQQLGLEGRIGIHLGEVERRSDDIGGLAVHLAARVMGVAQPGQILVTSTVVQATLGGQLRLRSAGAHDLKGLAEPWELFAVTTDPN
jgi:class 3 adenylate cyclase